jgi:hypothetical protein
MERDDGFEKAIEKQIPRYEKDQRYCGITDRILEILTKEQLNIQESVFVLEKAKRTIDAMVQAATWNLPLTCGSAINESGVWYPEKVKEAIMNRDTPHYS